jgi:hypothetical protein
MKRPDRRLWLITVLAGGVIAGTAACGSTASYGASPAAHKAAAGSTVPATARVLLNGAYEPSAIALSADNAVTDITWSAWGSTTATGIGLQDQMPGIAYIPVLHSCRRK